MRFVDTYVKQKIDNETEDSISVYITGTTVNYGDVRQYYIRKKEYLKKFELEEKAVERYRNEVKKTIATKDHKWYFILIDGTFWYSTKLLDFRKYNTYKNLADEPVKKNIGTVTLRQTIINWITEKQWNFKCGVSYRNCISFDGAARKMDQLFNRLVHTYPTACITIFYITERNPEREGHHNHMLVSITGKSIFNKKRTLERKIKSIGGEISECGTYDPQRGVAFVRYVTKHLKTNPESYYYLTNEDDTAFQADKEG